jgi:hypothetical protein
VDFVTDKKNRNLTLLTFQNKKQNIYAIIRSDFDKLFHKKA